MSDDRIDLDTALVSRLIRTQFPQWANLHIKPVESSGWDNKTFRLGERMSVRLPSAPGYAAQVGKEQMWLPKLAPHLPLPIPKPLAMGIPAHGYPLPWSIYGWLEGEDATTERIDDMSEFATSLAHFLSTLYRLDAMGGPPAGEHSFFRGSSLMIYDADTRNAVATLGQKIDAEVVIKVWEAALEATWRGPPVWFHGDVSSANLLVRDGQLGAVIDFGCSGVGDPACDLAIAWTFLSGESREMFRTALLLDEATWARGRGWTIWKALITLVETAEVNPIEAYRAEHVIGEVITDHLRFT